MIIVHLELTSCDRILTLIVNIPVCDKNVPAYFYLSKLKFYTKNISQVQIKQLIYGLISFTFTVELLRMMWRDSKVDFLEDVEAEISSRLSLFKKP